MSIPIDDKISIIEGSARLIRVNMIIGEKNGIIDIVIAKALLGFLTSKPSISSGTIKIIITGPAKFWAS